MEQLILLAFLTILAYLAPTQSETILSTVLTPDTKEKTLSRQGRSYYDYRYGARPLYDRLEYARPDERRCGRCYDDRYDDRDRDDRDGDDRDNDRSNRDRYDDDRRSHRPTSGNRYDRNKDDDDDDRRYNTDRKNSNKNETDNEHDNDKNRTDDDKDGRPSSGRRDRDRNRNRNRYDDRDRYRPDYYDRFLQRDRPQYDRPYYDDPYRERRPLYDRNPYLDDGYGGRYDGFGYPGTRRQQYDGYSRGGYDDAYGGYGPSAGRGPHDSFRPWDETYRGQAGWDAGGRGYYFASGRPEAASAWGQPQYPRPQQSAGGWQSAGAGYAGASRDPLDYRGSVGYGQSAGYGGQSAGYGGQSAGYGGQSGGYGGQGAGYGGQSAGYGQSVGYGQSAGYGQGSGYGQSTGYRQDLSASYGQPSASGWHSVGERIRPYRDQSGVNQLDNKNNRQPSRDSSHGQADRQNTYGQPSTYGQSSTYGQTQRQPTGAGSTTQQTSYLYERENEQVTKAADETTKSPS